MVSEQSLQVFADSIGVVLSALDAKAPSTKSHSLRVAEYAIVLAKRLGLPSHQVHSIALSAILHDVGKIGIEDRILRKEGRLTEEEFEIMKSHAVKGDEILGQSEQLSQMLPDIQHHHEAFDGTGYPDGLKGDNIPLAARIIAVAEAFDSMVSDQPYRPARSVEDAMDELLRCSGSQFDPYIVQPLVQLGTASLKLLVQRISLQPRNLRQMTRSHFASLLESSAHERSGSGPSASGEFTRAGDKLSNSAAIKALCSLLGMGRENEMRDILDKIRRNEWQSFIGRYDGCSMTNDEAGQVLTALFGSLAEPHGKAITEILDMVRRDEWHDISQYYSQR